ncbi:hypothetical protein MT996_05335 [Ornithobacterium rhinotracheale]|uniref:hypothetical protein n=2 Tax=Ornithobacterium rhinotracheale TaxID=28251 RepID=UPI001629C39D|nr:hypothetical protein [Ornithobacterium rhinotracheale]UOH78892.1 hypothetical protein MT996_05335 [Ornithobacterium rhinotracheale]
MIDIPPGKFAEQFIKDLSRRDVNSLDQIKWIFNGAKKPIGKDGKVFKETMEKAIDNLPITDDLTRKKLGIEFNQLTQILDDKNKMYEFTNVIASWAREKGYNGIIAPGARGAKDYQNVILFNQNYIDNILTNKTRIKINK